ncbi:bifunctional phosphoglucose/phosphomannose isomerase [bacterium]|nr:bifunctional phosphoglucose/phosphomannose isomerase [bacterium]
MKNIILNFPDQFKVGFKASSSLKLKKKVKGICICGMGGSALPGSILYAWINTKKIDLPVIVNRDYSLPYRVKKGWLVVCISYSGNTEETLSCFREALKNNLKVASIGSGGKLETLSKKYRIPFIKIPSGIPPRTAIGYQFGALVGILQNCGILSKKDIQELLALENIDARKLENYGKDLSQKIVKKIPIIYASNKFKIAARIWKIAFNENSKIPAFWNYFPELNHNEMVGFEEGNHKLLTINNNLYFIILRDKNDHQRIKKRMQLTAEILKKLGLKGRIIDIKGKTYLEKIFNSIILAYWTSYYLAQHYGINPVPVKLVEEFKKKLKTNNK